MEQYMKNWKKEMFSLKGGENEEPEIGWADKRRVTENHRKDSEAAVERAVWISAASDYRMYREREYCRYFASESDVPRICWWKNVADWRMEAADRGR